MKKETTIIVTAELTKHIDDVFDTPIEEFKQAIKEVWLQEMKNVLEGVENINITNMQVFELEKEERISTEELAEFANRCASVGCYKCPFYEKADSKNDCRGKLIKALAERLEELHNQQTATLKNCLNCSNDYKDFSKCSICKDYSEWRPKGK